MLSWFEKQNKYLLTMNVIFNIIALALSLSLGNGWLLSLAFMFFCGVYYVFYILLTKNLLIGTLIILVVIGASMLAKHLGEHNENSN